MITATVLFFMSATAETPRYIFMNQAPGIVWDQHRPETFTRAGFDDVVQTLHAPENQQLRVGISFFFSLLIRDLPALQESVRRLLALAEETGVPVLITFDGQRMRRMP
ncbi:MAG: hypothetical protein NTU83_07955 [Candidatus Hydrogenedentes bacterium]|nr:hypothetical protein [Candidatus Hydrogenedentota bacterium]